jgi:hypothetical protein
MPKISEKHIKINTGDAEDMIKFVVNYNQENKFYTILPERFNEQFDQLTDKELTEFSAHKDKKWKYSENSPFKRIISATSEDGVVENVRKICAKLLAMAVVKEPVIIVRFEFCTDHSHREKDETELEKIGVDLSATYCFKVTTGGDNAKFYKYETRDWFGEQKTTRSEVHLHRQTDAVVIPDTPENRQFIVDLHAALGLLIGKLKAFTADAETMTKMIADRQKLLSL